MQVMPPLTDNGKQSLAAVSQGEAMLPGAGIRLTPSGWPSTHSHSHAYIHR